ncbi:MAG: NTP transferase domain-containing protein [Candidatus Thalassarchaeaceae archaeon]|nr:NTP transferase domain-containing protein [Candidatus Thalassarchaeaceae archaeon]
MEGSRIACVILAAGSSSRLGTEKAILDVGSVTLVGWIARRLLDNGISPIIVTKSEIENEVVNSVSSCEVIVNPNPSRGRTGTLQIGISALDLSIDGAFRLLVVPVDRPGFSDSTLLRLIGSENTCCPQKDGRGGHPLILSVRDVEKIRRASPWDSLRDLVNPEKFEVDDPELHLNIDTPDVLENLTERLSGAIG